MTWTLVISRLHYFQFPDFTNKYLLLHARMAQRNLGNKIDSECGLPVSDTKDASYIRPFHLDLKNQRLIW
jgi:hypothetical protein